MIFFFKPANFIYSFREFIVIFSKSLETSPIPASDHITVWQTSLFFFNQVFDPGWPVTIPQSRRLGFFHFFFSKTFSTLNVSEHATVSQTGFKKTRSRRPCYGHWRPVVKCLRKKKTPFWQTTVWSLGFVKFVWSLTG